MVRTVSHLEDEVSHDSSSPTDNKIVDQKVNALRSKHSETEQRRRSKINERFQILRDLIPENDQKRDKASFLLEVIQYIQFLQEKLQMYEGSCQGWSPESTKCLPSRTSSGPVESFIDQSQFDRNFYGHEDNVLHPTLLSNAQNPVESAFTGVTLYKSIENLPMSTQALPVDMPLQPTTFAGVPTQPHQGSFPDADQLNQQSQTHFWPGRSCGDDCSVLIYEANEVELRSESEEANISNVHSQDNRRIGYALGTASGKVDHWTLTALKLYICLRQVHRLLNSLKSALQSSGVDLSHTSISVQLDVGKQTNGRSTNILCHLKDQENDSDIGYGSPMNAGKNFEHPRKKFKVDQM